MPALARWFIVGLVAIASLALGLYLRQQAQTPVPSSATPAATSGLMGVALPDQHGTEQRLDQWRGRVLVVNFWATWCAPCREEMPEFIKAQNEFGGKGLQFVGIAVDSGDKVRQFSSEIGVNYPILVGGFGAMELSRALGNTMMALPFTVIVNRKGEIAHTQLGILKPEKLASIIRQLL